MGTLEQAASPFEVIFYVRVTILLNIEYDRTKQGTYREIGVNTPYKSLLQRFGYTRVYT